MKATALIDKATYTLRQITLGSFSQSQGNTERGTNHQLHCPVPED
jgi:hypothetical protein